MIGQHFEEHRVHLRAVAYPNVGLVVSRPTTPSRRHGCGWTAPTQATSAISAAWFTTVVAGICLDGSRVRSARPNSRSTTP